MIADAEVEAAARRASTAGGGAGLGAHVERIIEQAETEGRSLVDHATTQAEALQADADADRAEAAEARRQSQVEAAALLVEARAEAETVRAGAVPAATAHVEGVLRAGRAELEAVQADIDAARARLEDIHLHIGQSLAHKVPLPVLADPQSFLPAPADHPDTVWDASAGPELIVGGRDAPETSAEELDISPW